MRGVRACAARGAGHGPWIASISAPEWSIVRGVRARVQHVVLGTHLGSQASARPNPRSTWPTRREHLQSARSRPRTQIEISGHAHAIRTKQGACVPRARVCSVLYSPRT